MGTISDLITNLSLQLEGDIELSPLLKEATKGYRSSLVETFINEFRYMQNGGE